MVHSAAAEVRREAWTWDGDELRSPVLVDRLRDLLQAEGGFTLDLRTGRPVAAGLAVCADPSRTLRMPLSDWNDDTVQAWLLAVGPELGSGPQQVRYIGGWLARSTGVVHLDVVQVVPAERRHLAEMLGRRHRQHAIFDLAGMTLVPLPT